MQIQTALVKLERALIQLQKALDSKIDDELLIDASIQRFEFTIELFWKFLQKVLIANQVEAPFPKIVMQKSFAGGLIDNEEVWLKMLADRNLTALTYDQVLAKEMFERISGYSQIMQKSLLQIKKLFSFNFLFYQAN